MNNIYSALARRCPRRPQEDGSTDGLRDYRIEELEKAIQSLDKRLEAMEIELPTLRLVRNWVIGGAVGVVSLVGVAGVALVLR